ncbi:MULTISPECIES: hypothetical protein, partial [unclassified Aeromonas]|uniref:hypothetical protein n=1 Tax=unclassified Aeromonas TaxID=257493 RepID=UPI0022E9175E
KRVIDQNGRSPSSTENSKIRCGMTDQTVFRIDMDLFLTSDLSKEANILVMGRAAFMRVPVSEANDLNYLL